MTQNQGELKPVIILYSLVCYVLGLGIFLYNMDFFVGIWVPKTVDKGTLLPLSKALIVDILLLTAFGLQHSIMARPRFKQKIKQLIPAAAERSTYILMSTLILAVVFYFWIPIPAVIYDVSGTVWGTILWSLYAAGWLVTILSTFLIDHFDLFGLRQSWYFAKNRTDLSYSFSTPFLYKVVRHPIYLGWLMIHWFTPYMTVGHALFATLITIYILIAIVYEERDLTHEFGEAYIKYKEKTRKLIPFIH